MYEPVLNAREVAQDLIDIAREQTDASIPACKSTVRACLTRILTSLPKIPELWDIKKALESENIVDVDKCYDAHVLEHLMNSLTDNIADKEQQSWTMQDDEEELIEMLTRLTSVLIKAERRVVLKKLGDFTFLDKLVVLYQIEQRKIVKTAVAKTLLAACSLTRKIISFLMCGNLPVIIVLNNVFKPPLNELETLSLKLLATLFSITERPPLSHNDHFTADFLMKMMDLISEENPHAFHFMINFNYQFDDSNPILETLQNTDSLTFGHLLINELNSNRGDEEVANLKMIWDIFNFSPDLVSKTFYSNDLKVLSDILSQILLDTNVPRKITMILEIFEKVLAVDSIPHDTIYASLKSFLQSNALDDALMMKAVGLVPPDLLEESAQ